MTMNEAEDMNQYIKNIVKPIILIAMAIFLSCCFIKTPESMKQCMSYISYSVSGVTFLFLIYEKYIWKLIPWNRPPVLKKEYTGCLSYVYEDIPGTKPISVKLKQSWFTIEITTKTDINASYTVTGTIVKEHGVDVLYYTYITNPSAISQSKNPIQYGTCRMILDNTEKIYGKYWTTSKTAGDIIWEYSH